MAAFKGPLRIKNASGGYDILHVESRADLIRRVLNGTLDSLTVEESLQNIESILQTKATIPSTFTISNIAVLNEDGNLEDSGHCCSDFATADHIHDEATVNLAGLMSALDKKKLDSIADGAEVNVVKSVNGEFIITADGQLEIKSISHEKISGLTNSSGESDTLLNILRNKVDKHGNDRLITEEEANKLESLIVGEDGTIMISGSVNLNNVIGLDEALNNKVTAVEGKGLSTNDFTDELHTKLLDIEDKAQVNVLESISINNVKQTITDKNVNIPIATESELGVVKSSTEENKVTVNEDGTMEVNTISMSKIIQEESDVFIFDGGTSEI